MLADQHYWPLLTTITQNSTMSLDDAAAMQIVLQALFGIIKYCKIVQMFGAFGVKGELILFVFG